MWKAPPPPDLSEERLALVAKLYEAFATTLGASADGVEVTKLQEMCITMTGPVATRPLTGDKITEMDAGTRPAPPAAACPRRRT